MDGKDQQLKFEIFTWKKLSHGLFDYHNRDSICLNMKVDPVSQVFIRVGSGVKSFPTFDLATRCKKAEEKKGNTKGPTDY
jgi:hypothetical protein